MDDKPYRSLNEYYRSIFGRKTAKISLDGGFTCPNRDGTLGERGCLFCSSGGSGDFAESSALSITEQIERGKAQTALKWQNTAYIAYFQAFTSTYAPVKTLRAKFEEALSCAGVEGLSIATRADCLPGEVLDLLEELSSRTRLFVELGLQSSKPETAELVRRGFSNDVFAESAAALSQRGIPVVAHIIIGLPGENLTDVLNTVDFVNSLPIQGVKLQLLHVLSDCDMADLYLSGSYSPLSKEEYISAVGSCIARLRPDIVIHRLTGDGSRDMLLAPRWSLNKRDVLNSLHRYLRDNRITQGMDFCLGFNS